MYESFYGFTAKPFQLNPDPDFYFGSRQHKRAMAFVEYGLHQSEGFIVITGEVGAGKTTLVRNLLANLDQNEIVAANLVSTQLEADDTLRMVASAFGLRTRDLAKSDLLLSLEALLASHASRGKRCLLLVDEAQNLSHRAVEELRMLSNFQLGTHALLQSFLIGQPEFRHILQSPEMHQLRQRVIAACHIGPLDADDTKGYIEHRLRHVGWTDESLFSPDAFPAVFQASGGVPRRINLICDRLLLSGFLAERRSFTAEDVREVAAEIANETHGAPDPAPGAGAAEPPASALDEGARRELLQGMRDAAAAILPAGEAALSPEQARLETRLQSFEKEIRELRKAMSRLERGNHRAVRLFRRFLDWVQAGEPPAGDAGSPRPVEGGVRAVRPEVRVPDKESGVTKFPRSA